MTQAAAIDVLLHIGGVRHYSTKIIVEDVGDALLSEFVQELLTEFSRNSSSHTISDEVDHSLLIDTLVQRIYSIKCKGAETTELYHFLHNSKATLGMLNSSNTPFIKNGLLIHLSSNTNVVSPKAPTLNAFSMMMGRGKQSTVRFLETPPAKIAPRLDEQIKSELVLYFNEDVQIGYFNPDQKKCLEKIIGQLSTVLCAVQKHWFKLVGRDFPLIPSKFADCKLLKLVTNCSRTSTKSTSAELTIQLVNYHLSTLASITWLAFKRSTQMKSRIDGIKSQVANLTLVWMDRKSSMIGKHSTFSPAPTISNTFSQLPSFCKLDSEVDEFFVAVLPSTKKKCKSHTSTPKTIAIDKALKKLTATLRHSADYSPIFLSDEDMGITDDAFVREGGTVVLSTSDRAHYRYAFKKKLCSGLELIGINIFGRMRSGSGSPSCILVWKVPLVNSYDHAGNIQVAIDKCRNIIPKQIQRESARRLDNLLRGISSVPRGVRQVMTNYLFGGECNINSTVADSYCQFVENLSAGLPIDESLIVDGRKFNSRGGRGIGVTQFEAFWNECRRLVDYNINLYYISFF